MKPFQNIALILLTLLVTACATKATTLDFSQGQQATARIELPEYIIARSVNGEEVKLPYLMSFPYTLSVDEGPVELKFIYSQEWGSKSGITEYIKSPVMKLDFNARAGNTYKLDYNRPNSITMINKADDYIKNMQVWLLEADQKTATAEIADDSPDKMTSPVAASQSSGDNLSELKRLWKAADADQRKAFMNWVISPDQE